jgi:hypothetical protein
MDSSDEPHVALIEGKIGRIDPAKLHKNVIIPIDPDSSGAKHLKNDTRVMTALEIMAASKNERKEIYTGAAADIIPLNLEKYWRHHQGQTLITPRGHLPMAEYQRRIRALSAEALHQEACTVAERRRAAIEHQFHCCMVIVDNEEKTVHIFNSWKQGPAAAKSATSYTYSASARLSLPMPQQAKRQSRTMPQQQCPPRP